MPPSPTSPNPAVLTDDDSGISPITPSIHPSSSAPAGLGLGIPSLLRTPPSTINLLPGDEPTRDFSNPRQTLSPPRTEERNNGIPNGSRTSPPSAGSIYTTFPFPSMRSGESAVASSEGGSNFSERPDTLPSLSTSGWPYARGRRPGRPSTASRRTTSDPTKTKHSLTQTVSRDAPSLSNSNSKRVSFDSESQQGEVTAGEKPDPPKKLQSSLERFKQLIRHPASDPVLPLHHNHRAAQTQTTNPASNPASTAQSRAQSPMRGLLLRNPYFWPARSPQEEPWKKPCDPYSSDSPRVSRLRSQIHPHHRRRPCHDEQGDCTCGLLPILSTLFPFQLPTLDLLLFWASITIRQVYRHILLRLPSLYFTRVWRIIFEAQVSKPEIERMIKSRNQGRDFPIAVQWIPPVVAPGLSRFKTAWEDFVETLLKEWKTLNVVSALLMSAILTIFQIEGTNQPITRTAALCSLVCALLSLIYGCVYVVRFTAMKNMIKAARWVEEAQQDTAGILWNVWVFLSLPAIFLAYSVIFFCVSIMAYIWTTGTIEAPSPIATHYAFIPRTIITVLFGIGIVYFYLVVTTFRSYADKWPSDDETPLEVFQDQGQTSPPGPDVNSTNNTHNGNNGNGNNNYINGIIAESREARDRRVSLRRFGIPDVAFPSPRRSNEAVNMGGNGVERLVGNLGAAGVVTTGGAGGFVPRPESTERRVTPTPPVPSRHNVGTETSVPHPLLD